MSDKKTNIVMIDNTLINLDFENVINSVEYQPPCVIILFKDGSYQTLGNEETCTNIFNQICMATNYINLADAIDRLEGTAFKSLFNNGIAGPSGAKTVAGKG